MSGGLLEIVISFKFRQNRLNGFRDVGVEICHFLYLRPVAYMYYRTSRDYSKSCKLIFVKLGRWMRHGPRTNRLQFGTDYDLDVDAAVIFHFSNIKR